MCRRLALAAILLLLAAPARANDTSPDLSLWQGGRALRDIAALLSFGPRAPGTEGHEKAVEYIESALRQSGADPIEQRWTTEGGERFLTLTNVIARLFPANPRRIILGTHYDSIIRAYRDKHHPDAPMPGANNSASGVALLLETARMLQAAKAPPPWGIDLVFFDGEEGPLALGAGDPQWHPLGSPYFAQRLDELYPRAKPEKAAIFDMVCWRDEKLRPERLSLLHAAGEVKRFWAIGRTFAPRFFSDRPTEAPIFDDHAPLIEAGIPSFLVIGFEYEPWFNTTGDTLDKCSEGAMNAVGRTLIRYIYQPGG